MKCALVTQASWSYRFGLNAILNGLDYHGNRDIDVHAIYAGFPEWYIAKATSTFDFGVHLYDHIKFAEERGGVGQRCSTFGLARGYMALDSRWIWRLGTML